MRPLSEFPPFLSILLVSKTFIDRRVAVGAMLKYATVVLKRLHFDEIDHFLDGRQRHLVERLALDWSVEHARGTHTTLAQIKEEFPNVKFITLDLRKFVEFDINIKADPTSDLWTSARQFAALIPPKGLPTIEFILSPSCPLHNELADADYVFASLQALTDSFVATEGGWDVRREDLVNPKMVRADCRCPGEGKQARMI